MRSQLRDSPGSALILDRLPANREGLQGPQRWVAEVEKQAFNDLFPHLANEDNGAKYNKIRQDCIEIRLKLFNLYYRKKIFSDPEHGVVYLAQEDFVFINKILDVIGNEFLEWFSRQPVTEKSLARSAEIRLAEFFASRPDVKALLTLAQRIPLQVETFAVTTERPLVVDAIELAIGLIPVIGNVVALYEAFRGIDLFGYRLTALERGVLAATVLLPLAGRLIKGGRALYTESRLVALYGQDAAKWSRVLAAEGRITINPAVVDALRQAEATLRKLEHLQGKAATEAADAIRVFAQGPTGIIKHDLSAFEAVLNDLVKDFPIFADLDSIALQRAIGKASPKEDARLVDIINAIKGQLLEELIEARIVPFLSEKHAAGRLALGLETSGKQLEFIPGHLITDVEGGLTDGILVTRDGNILDIVAVFEAKSGKPSARGLSYSKSAKPKGGEALKNFRQAVRDEFFEQRAEALAKGQSYKKTLAEVEKEFSHSELGGQVRRDIERLAEATAITIGVESTQVRISPTKTKFFGVIPKNVDPAIIEEELKDCGYLFEVIGVDVLDRDLVEAARRLWNSAPR